MAQAVASRTLSLEDVCRRINEISTLPQVALRVMEVANDPNSTASDLKTVMETDPALSARVLRCVNSSAYASRAKITNLQHAIAYLGIKQIRNLAMTASVSKFFTQSESIGPYCRRSLWRHMVAVGIAARMLGMRLRLHDFEDIFIAGLLHDIGLILEDQHVHAGFCKVIDSMAEGQSLCALETQHVGFDHCRLGESLAKAWKLPGGVAETIRYHHDAARYTGPHISTVRCVETANFICSLKGITSVGMQLVAFPKETFQQIGMSRDDLVVLATDLDREMSINENMFQI